LLDEGSSSNTMDSNTAQYGGDGIFLRALDGACGSGNLVLNNQTSFSPNNSVESWCPGNVFQGNTATQSHYGFWLGGSDQSIVKSNIASNNVVDGISIQHGPDRHSMLQDNIIQNNGRNGLLLSGNRYEAGDFTDPQEPIPWNSSQIVVQRNTFGGNAFSDLFTTFIRLVTQASNCGLATQYSEASDTTLVTQTLGSCSGGIGRTPPTAKLASPNGTIHTGTPATFDASHSALGPSGGTLHFTWLVQLAGSNWGTATLPNAVLAQVGTAQQTVVFPAAGSYDVDVTVDDGFLAAEAFTTVTVAP
jgi:parallel beta-helix repeat protein